MSERRAGSVSRMLRPNGDDSAGRASAFGGGSFDEVEESIERARTVPTGTPTGTPTDTQTDTPTDTPNDNPEPDTTIGQVVTERSVEPEEGDQRSSGPAEPDGVLSVAEWARREARSQRRAGPEAASRGAQQEAQQAARGVGGGREEALDEALAALGSVVAAGEVMSARKGYHLPEAVVWALEDLRTHYQRVERFSPREASHSNIVAAAIMRYHEDTFGRGVEL